MTPKSHHRALRFWRWGIAAIVSALLVIGAGHWAWQQELHATALRLRQASEAYTLALRGIVDRYSDLPYVMARQPAVQALLLRPSPGPADAVNRYLADLQRHTQAEALYVVDAQGLTLAASNWDTADSFVGQSYRQRPYFEDAMKGERGLFYGVGLTTGRPGLFIAEPIRDGGRIIGVGVVKLGLERLQRAWSADADPVVLQDRRGIVFLSSVADWLYRRERTLTAADLAWIREHDQYSARAGFAPLPWRIEQSDELPGPRLLAEAGGRMRDLLAFRTELPEFGWTLTVTGDLRKVLEARQRARIIAGLIAIVALLGTLYWRQRKKRYAERRQVELERAAEARQHEQERQLQVSARLASVGEMASTLAHELNQPLMAVSNFAVAARALVESGQQDMLVTALDGIVEQSGRASDIVKRVRAFINPKQANYAPIDINACAVHAYALLAPDLKRARASCSMRLMDDPPGVRGDSVLLEQVLVNLVQNAIQAMHDLPAARRQVVISTRRRENVVEVTVADRGPGVDAEQADRIFTPFFSTRAEGLGLGLNICRTIVEAHGGQITITRPAEGGAAFTFSLPIES
ncbi:sensor histidine kinase [Castellaniella sp.]|uniref:sensor histidine kinase n=1 Tax=Castellaniella sp. TaxID=1955812 RepID=UPI003C749997